MAAAPALINTDFERAIARNKRNTLVLIAVLSVISGVLGYVLGWAYGILDEIWGWPAQRLARLTAGAVLGDLVHWPPRPDAVIGAAVLLGLGLVWGLVTLYGGSRILSAFVGARDADPTRPEEKRFIDVVEEMAIAAGLPRPRPMVVDTPALNAFASGFSPAQATVTATSGILATLTRAELEGVIGHEMSHVVDYDVRYSTVVAAMAGVVVLVLHLLLDVLRWSSYGFWSPGPRRGRDDGGGGVRIALTLLVLLIVGIFAVAAALASKLVQLAISRQREYLADAGSVKLTRDPVGLIQALKRLEQSDTALARPNSPVSALCIAPVRMSFDTLFSTHPPLEDRIQRLQNLGGVSAPAAAPPSEPPAPPAPEVHHGPWG